MEDKIKVLEHSLTNVVSLYDKISFSSSLGAEDMVLTDIIAKNEFPITMFTLDTGRLHEETYQLMQQVQDKYDNQLTVYCPDASELETFVSEVGPNAFYDSIESRKSCCRMRKVKPLKRALKNRQVWVTGLRNQQSVTRTTVETFSWDEAFSIYKLNPLLHWSTEDVWNYINTHDVPYNALHHKGFPSIGCSPCTRAITHGEDERAGRWWWESPETKECGLHVVKDISSDLKGADIKEKTF